MSIAVSTTSAAAAPIQPHGGWPAVATARGVAGVGAGGVMGCGAAGVSCQPRSLDAGSGLMWRVSAAIAATNDGLTAIHVIVSAWSRTPTSWAEGTYWFV